ncbi:ATP-dependent protease [Gammaproteobacteria bacterium 45_16_T64]|nr:ATP-dependent protease [Gammaproteobacteria bacterium 45_16_T64]
MKLSVEQLFHPVHSDDIAVPSLPPGDSTGNSAEDEHILGQRRATEALEFGIDINQPGYNLYVSGENGTGRVQYVMDYLSPVASLGAPPLDWLYVNNFDNPREPRVLSLPPQQGANLLKAFDGLIESLVATFPATFDHPTFQQQKSSLQRLFDRKYDTAIDEIERQANNRLIAVYREEGTISFTPLVDGQAADEAVFAQLEEEQRNKFQKDVVELEGLLNKTLLELPQWQRDLNDQLKELREGTIRQAIKPLFDDIQKKYPGNTAILLYVAQVHSHLPRIIEEYLGEEQESKNEININKRSLLEDLYRPNLIIRSIPDNGAPIVVETNPHFGNLFGQLDAPQETTPFNTHFQQLSAGALHRANGGYLILHVEKVLREPSTWEALKRALQNNRISFEPPIHEAQLGIPSTLSPESIPLSVKIILIGPRDIYYTLAQLDSEFDELFRVLVDFSGEFNRTSKNLYQFSQLLQHKARKKGLAELSDSAIAHLTEHACRLAEHQQKLSARIEHIMEVAIEADYLRSQEQDEVIKQQHIVNAIDAREYRNSRLSEQVREQILDGTIVISTTGVATGQMNGLSIIEVGESVFGCPSRITASVHPGNNGVVDIEREVELGQSAHSKGVLLLGGYLCGRYAKDFPLAISAHIAMEQSYGYIDGDSASLAELCALISALVNIPLRQDIAITGSVNQRGEVQAIGGVNEKIEGFFDICLARGLTGNQGVIIPATNQPNLMLAKRVVEAVKNKEFFVYTSTSVDQTLELLTGRNMGKENSQGKFPTNSVNQQVVKRLKEFSKIMKHSEYEKK